MANTPNLGLHQWAAGDSFLRTDFNEDFGKIDTGVAGRCQMVTGTYIGTAQDGVSSTSTQFVPLPFTPKAVMVRDIWSSAEYSATVQMGQVLLMGNLSMPVLEIVEGGFRATSVYWGGNRYTPALNQKSYTYYYLAFG